MKDFTLSKKRKKNSIRCDGYLASTAMHAVENNYRTVLVEDACRGVNEKDIELKRAQLNENGCIFVDSKAVKEKKRFFSFRIFQSRLRFLEWSLVMIVDLN